MKVNQENAYIEGVFNQDSTKPDDFLQNSASVEEVEFPPKRNQIQIVDLDQIEEEDFLDVGKSTAKTLVEATRIESLIESVTLFQSYNKDELAKVVRDYMYLKIVKSGDVVIQFGSEGDAFYVVKSGKYACTVPDEAGSISVVYDNSGYFGELALINRAPRAATVTAITDGELWCLCALRCSWLRRRQAVLNAECFERVLKAIPLFKENMKPEHLNRLIDAIETLNLPAGHVICRQGDTGDAMYFILDGEVDILINDVRVKTIKKNEFFGERALVLDEGRAATCTIAIPSRIAKLPRESFSLLIPDNVIDQMRRHIAATYNKQASAESPHRQSVPDTDSDRSSVCLESSVGV